MINEFGNYDSLDDFQTIYDYFSKHMTGSLTSTIDGYMFELYLSDNFRGFRNCIRMNKIPTKYIHEINNYFDLYICITI